MPKATGIATSELEKFAQLGERTSPDAERALLQQYQLQDLPEEDGVPLETYYHRLQIALLHELVHQLFKDRTDYYCGGNMFLRLRGEQ
jgi:hypothetical protein